MAHVFVSYVREDSAKVTRLAEALSSFGIKVWLDRDNIKAGQKWKDAIRDGISQGAFFLACFSQAYCESSKTYMNEELTLAVEELRQRSSGLEWFIPVLLDDCEPPRRAIGGGETLADLQQVLLFKDWADGINRILAVIQPISPILEEWLGIWAEHNHLPPKLRARLLPLKKAGPDYLELSILNDGKDRVVNLVFADMQDRYGHKLLSIIDMNTYDPSLQKKRLMTLVHLFLLHSYKAGLVHYLSPTDDNQHYAQKMRRLGIFSKVDTEGQLIIVATVNNYRIADLLNPDREALRRLITKQDQPQPVA